MSDRFDLEQGIMQCWNVCDDIQLLLDSWDKLDEDGKLNYLIGIKQLYHLKFEKCWEYFEDCCKQRLVWPEWIRARIANPLHAGSSPVTNSKE